MRGGGYFRRNKPARTRARNCAGVSGADTGFRFGFALAATERFSRGALTSGTPFLA